MLLVLASLHDRGALWFVREARSSGAACTVVTTEALSFARRRSHTVTDGGVSTEVVLGDGTAVRAGEVSGVLNRSLEPPALAWRHAAVVERGYATSELHAFVLSWLAGLDCPVRNRPTPECLAGPVPNPLLAVAEAGRAGLACAPVRVGTGLPSAHEAVATAAWLAAGPRAQPQQLVLLDGEVVGGRAPPPVRAAAGRLAAAIGADSALIGLDLLVADGEWWFAGASPLPALHLGGPALVTRLLDLLVPRPAGVVEARS